MSDESDPEGVTYTAKFDCSTPSIAFAYSQNFQMFYHAAINVQGLDCNQNIVDEPWPPIKIKIQTAAEY